MVKERLVYIVDNDDAVRRSASFLLNHAGYRAKPVKSGIAFAKIAKRAQRGCVLLDIQMPEMDGLEVQNYLNKHCIQMPVIVLTGSGGIKIAVQALRAGAIDFLEKPYEKETLIAAIKKAFEHLENHDLKEDASRDAKIQLACLTGRERDVLGGLMAGCSNEIIARNLGISLRTVDVFRANVMEKLRVRNLAQALRIGIAAESGAQQIIPNPVLH